MAYTSFSSVAKVAIFCFLLHGHSVFSKNIEPATAIGERNMGRIRTIREVIKFEVDVICDSFDSAKQRIEDAFEDFFRDEFRNCNSDRDVQSINLVRFQKARVCDDDSKSVEDQGSGRKLRRKRNKSKGKVNISSKCRKCDDRRNLETYLIDLDTGNISRHNNLRGLGNKKKKKKKRKGGRSCDANLSGDLKNQGFESVVTDDANVEKTREANCSPNSADCISSKSTMGACCGVQGCVCTTPSVSLCEAENCCPDPFQNPCFCQNQGSCGNDPCDGTCLTDSPTVRPSASPSDSPSDHPSEFPSVQPSEHPSDQPTDTPSHHPSDSPSEQPSYSCPEEAPFSHDECVGERIDCSYSCCCC